MIWQTRWVKSLGMLLGLALCMRSAAWADEPGVPVTGEAKSAFLTAWNERLQNMQTLHMVFTQEKHLRMLRQALTAQGELWLKGERLLYTLTNTAGDTELIVSLDAQQLRTYYPLLQTLEVVALQHVGALPRPVPVWAAAPEVLSRDYDTELFLDSTGLHTLRLVPKDAKAPVQALRLELRDWQPQVVEQIEKSGTRVLMRLSTFTVNAAVSETQLELRVPTGTRVIQPLQ